MMRFLAILIFLTLSLAANTSLYGYFDNDESPFIVTVHFDKINPYRIEFLDAKDRRFEIKVMLGYRQLKLNSLREIPIFGGYRPIHITYFENAFELEQGLAKLDDLNDMPAIEETGNNDNTLLVAEAILQLPGIRKFIKSGP